MPKEYQIQGLTFTAQKNVLKIKNAFIPVRVYYQKLIKMFTEGIDITLISAYQTKLNTVIAKDRQDKSDLENITTNEPENTELINRLNAEIEKNKIATDNINAEYEADENTKKQILEYNIALINAEDTLFSTESIIIPFLEKYLIGDFAKINFEDFEVEKFINEVMQDFFLLILKSVKE